MVSRKVVIHSISGYRPEFDALVAEWIRSGVTHAGVVGADASRLEDIVDELCVGDGTQPYFMLTVSHSAVEGVGDAVALAEQLTGEFAGPVTVVEF